MVAAATPADEGSGQNRGTTPSPSVKDGFILSTQPLCFFFLEAISHSEKTCLHPTTAHFNVIETLCNQLRSFVVSSQAILFRHSEDSDTNSSHGQERPDC